MARIAKAFDMRVIFWDIMRFPGLEEDYEVEYVSWEEIFKQADILSVHLALNDKTHKIIGKKEIDSMKPTSFFVNTARGKLVDQPALVDALFERRWAGQGWTYFTRSRCRRMIPSTSCMMICLRMSPSRRMTHGRVCGRTSAIRRCCGATSGTSWMAHRWNIRFLNDESNVTERETRDVSCMSTHNLQFSILQSPTMIKFGYCLPIFAWPGARLFRTPAYPQLDAATTMKLGKLAEDLGYHSIWVADHLMLGKDEAILEGWTTLAAVAGMTQRVQLGIIHYNNAFRHPALTAKVVATLDQISGGRYIHFVDYGNQPREFLAYGLHANDAIEDRIAHMNEGVEIALKLL